MRRKLLLPVATVLVLIPSAIFFFQSSEFVRDAEDRAPSFLKSAGVDLATNSTPELTESAELREVRSSQRDPVRLLEDACKDMPEMDEKVRDEAIEILIAELRTSGSKGMEAVRQFLASGRDVPLRNGLSFSEGRLSKAPTLRLALIDALRDWPGSAGVVLAVLKSPATVFESIIATRALEFQFPGTYRNEAIQSLKVRIEDPSEWKARPLGEDYLYDVARHFQAEDLLPQLHALVMKEPLFRSADYVRMLDGFSPQARAAALDRLIAEPKFAETFIANPHIANHFSYMDERMRAFAVHAFTQIWQPAQKLKALNDLVGLPPDPLISFFLRPGQSVWTSGQMENDLREARARKALLAEMESAADTPELQNALKKARATVAREIARQVDDRRYDGAVPAEVEFGSGDGKATIKGRRIENIELRSTPIIPKVEEDDSTQDIPR